MRTGETNARTRSSRLITTQGKSPLAGSSADAATAPPSRSWPTSPRSIWDVQCRSHPPLPIPCVPVNDAQISRSIIPPTSWAHALHIGAYSGMVAGVLRGRPCRHEAVADPAVGDAPLGPAATRLGIGDDLC